MNLLRRITEGLGAWLHYEYCCDRQELFSESYMAPPVGVLLSSAQQGRVFGEFKHPILKGAMTGRGRRPAVDFVVCKDGYIPIIAIETKWIGRTSISVESVLWDLVRLALLNQHFDTKCYFILGGTRRELHRFFRREDFTGPNGDPAQAPILDVTSNYLRGIPLLPTQRYRIAILRRVFDGWPETLQAPTRFSSRRTRPFPDAPSDGHFQVYAWEISCPPKKELFWPKKSRHYQDIRKTKAAAVTLDKSAD